MVFRQLNNYSIILASGSPRRKQLLDQLGLAFRIEVRQIDETFPETLNPSEVAEYLSNLKAEAFPAGELNHNELVITADTIVTLENEMLAKPVDRKDAFRMLRKLSGKTHQVITGVTLKTTDRSHTFSVSTDVKFKSLTEEEIAYYIDHYKPYDKAGAYGIQEWIGHVAIDYISGSYFNVMGLPTHRLYEELLQFAG
jgi:septum formation protein